MNTIRKIKKAIGALLGGITAGAVVAILEAFNMDVTLQQAGAIAILLTTLGTYLAPKNITE